MFGLLMRRLAWPLAIMLSSRSGPGQKHALDWRSGTCGLSRSVGRLAWVRYPFNALSNLVRGEQFPRVFVLLPYVYAGSGAR